MGILLNENGTFELRQQGSTRLQPAVYMHAGGPSASGAYQLSPDSRVHSTLILASLELLDRLATLVRSKAHRH